MSEFAFLRREACGCASAITVEDTEFHYVRDLAVWQRAGAAIERVSVEQARAELAETFRFHPRPRRGRQSWAQCARNQQPQEAP